MIARSLLIAAALLAVTALPARAQVRGETIAVPTLRASVTVADDIVRGSATSSTTPAAPAALRSTAHPTSAPQVRCRSRRC
ncbi:hypothetical protein ACVWY2_002702 [Bradyrhizobium sp. JR6.1]